MYIQMVAPCLLGLEGLVSDDLKNMEAQNVCAENGRVFFEGKDVKSAILDLMGREKKSEIEF